VNVPGWTLAAPRAKDVLHALQRAPHPRLTRRLGSAPGWGWFGAGLLLGASLVWLLGPLRRAAQHAAEHETDEGPRGAA
jgi:hypothetical protein